MQKVKFDIVDGIHMQTGRAIFEVVETHLPYKSCGFFSTREKAEQFIKQLVDSQEKAE